MTEAAPMPTPPRNLEMSSIYQFAAKAHPKEDTKYSSAHSHNIARLPYASPGFPIMMDPRTVPMRAMETVKPSVASVSPNNGRRNRVVPEITAVSNPNRNPPSADTIVAKRSFFLTAGSFEKKILVL
jgi:hypothetical protein